MTKSKTVEVSLKDISKALKDADYTGFLLYADKEENIAVFSINGEVYDIALLLHQAFRKHKDLFNLVTAAVFAHSAVDKKAKQDLEEIYEIYHAID